MYRTLTAQTLHYLARPHSKVLRTPLVGAAAWRGDKLRHQTDLWCHEVTPDQVREIEAAIESAKSLNRPTESLASEDFPLPTLSALIDEWREELSSGRGFRVIRGLPVRDWTQADSELFFWCFGLHLGLPGAQNPEGDLLGHVTDTGAEAGARDVRQYRTAEHIPYHCDAADVVGLLCLQKAASGGESLLVSSVSVYNELLARRPDLVARLYRPFLLDTKGEGGLDYFPVPPCRYFDGQLRTFWHGEYFRTVQAYTNVSSFTALERELLDLYDEIAMGSGLRLGMSFEPGDIQLVSNHTVLHSRTAFEDGPGDDKRHLLRLWLSLNGDRSVRYRYRRAQAYARLLPPLAGKRVARLVKGPSELRSS